MEQLAGNENRPRQLGNTGIIVLTKCEMGECDCNSADSKKNNKNKNTEKTRNRRPLISKAREVPDRTPIITRTPLRRPRPVLSKLNSEEDKKVKFTDHRGNVKEGIITGTSVSTSVSSSTSVEQSDQDKSEQKNLSPAELLRQRLKLLYSQRRRFY
jgi:hypothetical protein